MLLHIIRLIQLILYLFTYSNSVIYTYVSFRRGKSDCDPQEGLVKIISNFKQFII